MLLTPYPYIAPSTVPCSRSDARRSDPPVTGFSRVPTTATATAAQVPEPEVRMPSPAASIMAEVTWAARGSGVGCTNLVRVWWNL